MDSKYKKLYSSTTLAKFDHSSIYKNKKSTEDLVSSSQSLLTDSEEDTNPDFDGSPHYHRQQSYVRAIVAHPPIFVTYSVAVPSAISFFRQQLGLSPLTYSKNPNLEFSQSIE